MRQRMKRLAIHIRSLLLLLNQPLTHLSLGLGVYEPCKSQDN
jgi:hypothetical protein